MEKSRLDRERERVGRIMGGLLVAGIAWYAVPSLRLLPPESWGTREPRASVEAKTEGHALFVHEWTPNDPLAGGDGLGPVFNASSCVACHHQGGAGGGGPIQANVTAFAAAPTSVQPIGRTGVIHNGAVRPEWQETVDLVRTMFPVPPANNPRAPAPDPLLVGKVNTPSLFGAGWIDRISDRAVTERSLKATFQQMGEELAGKFDGQTPGRPHYLPDGRVGKFGWKAQFATLSEFVAAACANEVGLGTPQMRQTKPLASPGYPDSPPDLSVRQLTSLTAFVDTLPRPIPVRPGASFDVERAERGREIFSQIGCAVCHPAELGGVKDFYSDLLLHKVEDDTASGSRGAASYYNPAPPPPEPDVRSVEPLANEWRTPPLWGVADSAPYFHDGGSPTLEAAIMRHAGTAKPVAKAFRALGSCDQQALVAFLTTMRAPAAAPAIPAAAKLLAASVTR